MCTLFTSKCPETGATVLDRFPNGIIFVTYFMADLASTGLSNTPQLGQLVRF